MRTILTDREEARLRAAASTYCGSKRNMNSAVVDVMEIMQVDRQDAEELLGECDSAGEFFRKINCEIVYEPDEDFGGMTDVQQYKATRGTRPRLRMTLKAFVLLWLTSLWLTIVGIKCIID